MKTKPTIKKPQLWENKDGDRYGANYHQIAKLTHLETDSHCCLCFFKTGKNEAHHAMYRDKYGKIRDREIAGVHIFSLCIHCHGLAHKPENWKQYQDKSYNRNTDQFYDRLDKGFRKMQKERIKRETK